MRGDGWVVLRVSGLSVEKLLNAAREQGIVLHALHREKNRDVTLRLAPGQEAAFRALAEEKGYAVGESRRLGPLRWGRRLRRRGGLLAGVVLAAALAVWSLGCVWQVRIENAGPYAGEVRAYLEQLGVRAGMRRSAVRLGELREKLEWRLPKVKWVRVEWAGVILRVRLEPGTPPPEGEDASAPSDVVAAEDGLLKRLTVFAGTPEAKAGDFVRAGQTLIRGEERDAEGKTVPVAARGEAIARVWVTVRSEVPLKDYASVPTGRQTERTVLRAPFFSWSLTDEPDYLTWDMERKTVAIGGAWLPVWAERETYAEVYLQPVPRNLEDVTREGEKAALLRLNQALIGDETVDKWINCSMIEGEYIIVEATAETVRDIARREEKKIP